MKWSGVHLLHSLRRRWRRQRRRQKVGRAYDMALEIARQLPSGLRILDVGCGNGFIAHHLAGMLQSKVTGLDVQDMTDAAIDYIRYDGSHFPVRSGSFDVVLLCYVLHHAADASSVLQEVKRVLGKDGVAVIYEDMPQAGWDRLVCWTHNRRWQARTGCCSFRLRDGWHDLFTAADFEVASEKPLSRWRNLAHPVSRRSFIVKARHPQEVDIRSAYSPGKPAAAGEIYVAA